MINMLGYAGPYCAHTLLSAMPVRGAVLNRDRARLHNSMSKHGDYKYVRSELRRS